MMKDKFIMFVIVLLVGAIIASGSFFVYTIANNSSKCDNQQMQGPGGQPPEMPNGQNGQPPAMPNGQNPQQSSNNS